MIFVFIVNSKGHISEDTGIKEPFRRVIVTCHLRGSLRPNKGRGSRVLVTGINTIKENWKTDQV